MFRIFLIGHLLAFPYAGAESSKTLEEEMSPDSGIDIDASPEFGDRNSDEVIKCTDYLETTYKEKVRFYVNLEKKLLEQKKKAEENADQTVWGICKRAFNSLLEVFSEEEKIFVRLTEESQRKCVKKAQTTFGVDRFVRCDRITDPIESKGEFILEKEPPCILENYIHLNAYLFKKAADCVGVSKDDLFPLIAQESGFHPTIISETGCIGIPQTDTGTRRTLQNYGRLSELTDAPIVGAQATAENAVLLMNEKISKNPACVMFRNFLKMKKDPKNACEFLHASVNPEVGYFLAAKNFLVNQSRIKYKMSEWKEFFPEFDWSPENRKALVAALTTVAHNAGTTGILTRFELALDESRSLLKKIMSEGGEKIKAERLMEVFRNYALKYHRGPRRREKEVADYYRNVATRESNLIDKLNLDFLKKNHREEYGAYLRAIAGVNQVARRKKMTKEKLEIMKKAVTIKSLSILDEESRVRSCF